MSKLTEVRKGWCLKGAKTWVEKSPVDGVWKVYELQANENKNDVRKENYVKVYESEDQSEAIAHAEGLE